MQLNHQIYTYIGVIKTMTIVAFFEKLNKLNFQGVEKQLISSNKWTAEKTQVAISRYKLFLYLKSLYPAVGLVPTPEIDAVWHAHIEVNLLQYIHDSNYLFGYTLNHLSTVGQTEEILQLHQQAFTTTKALFEKVFGRGVLEPKSVHIAACADIPFDTTPAVCADLITPNPSYVGY